jgi:hypothetical protein
VHVDDVTAGLDLAPGAFGRATGAVQTVLNDLHDTPVAPDVAGRMIRETTQEGLLRPETRTEAIGDLVGSGMAEDAAAARVTTMQSHMQKLPTQIRLDDALSAEAMQAKPTAYSGYSSQHRATPAGPPAGATTGIIRRPPTTMTTRARATQRPTAAGLPAPGLPQPGLPAPPSDD